MRSELSMALVNCSDMKAAIDTPAGTYNGYRTHVSLLKEKHRWYIEPCEPISP